MGIILFLIIVLTVGYLTAHFLMDKLKSRYLLVGGLEYMFLGAMLGPVAADLYTRIISGMGFTLEAPIELITDSMFAALSPAITLGIGSIGLLAGLHLNLSKRRNDITSDQMRTSAIMHVASAIIIGIPILCLLVLYIRGPSAFVDLKSFLAAPFTELMPFVLVIVATSIVSAVRPIQYTIERYGATGPVSTFVVNAADISASAGIIIFGLVFCIDHPASATMLGRELTPVEWMVIQVAVGIVLGSIFKLFISNEDESDKLLVALLGIILFSTGIAWFLKLSPIVVNFFLGLVLANFSDFRDRLRERLEQVEKPFDICLYFFAGVAWKPTGIWYVVLVLIAVYLFLRWFGKIAGSRVAFATGEQRTLGVRDLGTGLIAQGSLSVAMVLNFYLTTTNTPPSVGAWVAKHTTQPTGVIQHGVITDTHDLAGMLMTVIFAAVVINELIAFRATRNLLINAGEIEPDAKLRPEDL